MSNTKQPTYGNGKICYIEIPAIDISVSAAFYQKVFGWFVRTDSDGRVAFDDTVTEVSGTWVTNRKPAVTDSGYMVHIMIYDMTKTLQAVMDHGGKIVQPIGKDLPEITAKFSDPAGNVFGLYQHGG